MILIQQWSKEYHENRTLMAQMKKRQDELAKLIKEHAISTGTKDSNGSHYAETDNFVYGNQAKKSVKLNQERAKAFFLGRGLYDKVVKVEETVDENKVEQLIVNGELSPEELETVCDIKTTYALVLKEKEVVSEEEIPTVEVVNSSKKRRFRAKK